MAKADTCGNCAHWSGNAERTIGRCKRAPPTWVCGDWQQPQTSSRETCGEWVQGRERLMGEPHGDFMDLWHKDRTWGAQ